MCECVFRRAPAIVPHLKTPSSKVAALNSTCREPSVCFVGSPQRLASAASTAEGAAEVLKAAVAVAGLAEIGARRDNEQPGDGRSSSLQLVRITSLHRAQPNPTPASVCVSRRPVGPSQKWTNCDGNWPMTPQACEHLRMVTKRGQSYVCTELSCWELGQAGPDSHTLRGSG